MAAELTSIFSPVAAWIIGTLMTVITAETACIVWMQKRADKIYGYRLAERDTANAALNAAAAAQQAQAAATRERNQLQEELTETINALTNSIAIFIEKQTIHHTHLVSDQSRVSQVIEAIAAAMREAAMQSTGVKDKVDVLLAQLPGMSNEIKAHIKELVEDVERAAINRKR